MPQDASVLVNEMLSGRSMALEPMAWNQTAKLSRSLEDGDYIHTACWKPSPAYLTRTVSRAVLTTWEDRCPVPDSGTFPALFSRTDAFSLSSYPNCSDLVHVQGAWQLPVGSLNQISSPWNQGMWTRKEGENNTHTAPTQTDLWYRHGTPGVQKYSLRASTV